MALFAKATPTDKALADLQGLHRDRGKLESTIAEREAELSQLRAGPSEDSALDEFLSGEPAVDAEGFPAAGMAQVAAVEQKLQGLRGARAALIRKYKAALLDLGKKRSAVFLAGVQPLKDQLKVWRETTTRLHSELQSHTGRTWVIDELNGAFKSEDANGHQSIWPRRGSARDIPQDMVLLREIARLEGQARKVEADLQRAAEGGMVSGESIEALLLICSDPERLAPTEAAVRQWFERATAQAAAEWARLEPAYSDTNPFSGERTTAPEHDVVYSLAWADGTIVEARSNAKPRPKLQLGNWTAGSSPTNTAPMPTYGA